MADAVHTIDRTEDTNSGIGFMLGMVLVIALVLVLFFWALPQMSGSIDQSRSQGNPSGGVDVNVNQP